MVKMKVNKTNKVVVILLILKKKLRFVLQRSARNRGSSNKSPLGHLNKTTLTYEIDMTEAA